MNETLKDLLEYLQNKIDSGEHKIFYNDLGWDIKTIDCINAINEQQEEIERLNNIINELEKYCIEEIEYYSKKIKSQYITDNTRGQYEGEKVCFEDILGRLQELKGDGSND